MSMFVAGCVFVCGSFLSVMVSQGGLSLFRGVLYKQKCFWRLERLTLVLCFAIVFCACSSGLGCVQRI